jgi:hypothetical protein
LILFLVRTQADEGVAVCLIRNPAKVKPDTGEDVGMIV